MAYFVVVDGEFLWNGVNILVNHSTLCTTAGCGTSFIYVALLEPLI